MATWDSLETHSSIATTAGGYRNYTYGIVSTILAQVIPCYACLQNQSILKDVHIKNMFNPRKRTPPKPEFNRILRHQRSNAR